MPLKKKDDYIPIKCEGWNGKFQHGHGTANNVSKVRRYNQQLTDCRDYFGYDTKPTILPTEWDGKFNGSKQDEITSRRECGNQNRNTSFGGDIHGYNNETIILPPQWNGEFELDPNDIRIKPERNMSDQRDFMDRNLIKNSE